MFSTRALGLRVSCSSRNCGGTLLSSNRSDGGAGSKGPALCSLVSLVFETLRLLCCRRTVTETGVCSRRSVCPSTEFQANELLRKCPSFFLTEV